MEQAVDRSTKNIWELLTKSQDVKPKAVVGMIKHIFPSFAATADNMLKDKAPLDLSAYYVRVHGVSRMLEIMQNTKGASKSSAPKAAMTGLSIQNDSGRHYIVVNAVKDEGLHVVRIDGKRAHEIRDHIFSSLEGTTVIPRDQCRCFHLEQAPPRLVIGTPPPPMTEAERALKSTARQLKIAQNKEAKAKKAKKNADGSYNPEGEEVEDSDQSEDEEGKPSNPKKAKGAKTQAAEPGEASKRVIREMRTIVPKDVVEKITYMRRVLPDEFDPPADLPEAQEWETVEEIVYKETLGIYEEQREVPEHVQQQVEDILKVLSPAVVVVMLTNAVHTIEKLKAALKTINKDKPPWQHNMLKGLGLTPQEQAEIKARSAIRENPDIQDAVANNQGWVSDYHISVIPVIMKQLDEFVGEDPKRPSEDLAASVVPEGSATVSRKTTKRRPNPNEVGQFKSARNQVKRMVEADKKQKAIGVFHPIGDMLKKKRTPNTFLIFNIQDSSGEWRNALGLREEPIADYPDPPELFFVVQKDTLIDNKDITSKALMKMGIYDSICGVIELDLTENQIMGNEERQKRFMQLYECGHKDMCILWNELASSSVFTIDVHTPLSTAVRDEFRSRTGKIVKPFFIPIGMGWTCNPDEKEFGHSNIYCRCASGRLNPFADTIFTVFMNESKRKMIYGILFPGNLLAFANMTFPCERFKELFVEGFLEGLLR